MACLWEVSGHALPGTGFPRLGAGTGQGSEGALSSPDKQRGATLSAAEEPHLINWPGRGTWLAQAVKPRSLDPWVMS